MRKEDMNALYDAMDRNKSGKIEYDDFIAFIEEPVTSMKKQIETKLSKKEATSSSSSSSSTKYVKSRLSRSIRRLERKLKKCEVREQQQQNQGEFVVSGSTIRPDSTKRRARTHLSRCAEESLLSSANLTALPSPYELPRKPVGPQVEYAKRPMVVALEVDSMGRKGLFQSPRRR